jgi:hypothetical protein
MQADAEILCWLVNCKYDICFFECGVGVHPVALFEYFIVRGMMQSTGIKIVLRMVIGSN